MAACVTCVFAVTLSVFPVVTVRVQTVYKDSAGWGEMPLFFTLLHSLCHSPSLFFTPSLFLNVLCSLSLCHSPSLCHSLSLFTLCDFSSLRHSSSLFSNSSVWCFFHYYPSKGFAWVPLFPATRGQCTHPGLTLPVCFCFWVLKHFVFFFFFSSHRQSVHLRLLLYRLQRHGPGWPQRPLSAALGKCARLHCKNTPSLLSFLLRWPWATFAQPSKDSALFPAAVASRVLFVPLLMLCNVENSRLVVIFSHDAAFVAINALFSFSNGYLATLCMAYAPQWVLVQEFQGFRKMWQLQSNIFVGWIALCFQADPRVLLLLFSEPLKDWMFLLGFCWIVFVYYLSVCFFVFLFSINVCMCEKCA